MIGALVFAAATATIDLQDRTDVRLRLTSGQTPALDVANTPGMNLQMQAHRWTGDIFYAPSLQLQNLAPPPVQPTFLNSVALTSTWFFNHARIAIIEDGTIGEESTAYLGGLQAAQQNPTIPTMTATTTMTPTMSPTLQLLPNKTETIWFASSRSLLLVALQPSKRWQLSLDVGYFIYGGLDTEARQTLPLQRGPVADASAAYIFDDVDRFIANVNAQRLQFDEGPCLALATVNSTTPVTALPQCAPDEYIAVGMAGWSHALSRLSTASISLGASAVRSRLNPTDEFQTHVYPAGLLTYLYRTGIARRPTTLRVDAQVTPAVDNRTGLAENRAQLLATAIWTGERVKLTEVLGVARSLGSPLDPPSTFVLTSSSALYSLSKHAAVGAEVDYVWQDQERFGAYSSLVAQVSFVAHAPVQRF